MKSASNGGVLKCHLQMLHVHVLLVAPLGAGHMAQSGADQHESRVAIRKTAHHTGTAADLPAQPLNDIVGADTDPDLILETVCTRRKTIRVAGDDYPAELMKSKFMKLDSEHIRFVLDCLNKNTTEIRNIKQYLRAALFNAPSTIGNYYSSLVAHDMATGKI